MVRLFIYYKRGFLRYFKLNSLRIAAGTFTFLIFALNVAIQFCEASLDG